jgi:DNA excision repair protein ERCC-8
MSIDDLERRLLGLLSPTAFCHRYHEAQARDLALTALYRFNSLHDASVMSIALDAVDGRFLLTTGGTRLCVYDLERRPFVPSDSGASVVAPVASASAFGGAHPLAHKNSMSSLCWYPHDTGMFVSGAFDHSVRVWDTNTLSPVSVFRTRALVYQVAMSPAAVAHTLVAVAADCANVLLCDLTTGKATHQLVGHSGALRAVAWSPSNEFLLASAGTSGCIRFWDIRRATTSLYCCDATRASPISPKPPSLDEEDESGRRDRNLKESVFHTVSFFFF